LFKGTRQDRIASSPLACAMPQQWKIVGGAGKGGIVVRDGQDLQSPAKSARLATGALVEELDLRKERLHYRRVSGAGPDEGWISISAQGRPLVELHDVQVSPKDVAVSEKLQALTLSIEREDSARGKWLQEAQAWLRSLNNTAQCPYSFNVPENAPFAWEVQSAVLSAVTHGQFDPIKDVPDPSSRLRPQDPQQSNLVSVLYATSDARRAFHPLLYENFKAQTYEPRELVVVHTGIEPSEFFQAVASQDARVVYRFFAVSSEAPGSPRLIDEQVRNPMAAVLWDDKPSEVLHWEEGSPFGPQIVRDGWTKGLKRNLACAIASGSVLAHFDDGCLYAANYLELMLAELRRQTASSWTEVAAIALSDWYYWGIQDHIFRRVDLKSRERLWDDFGNPRDAMASDQWQHGFAFMYTRAAWRKHPFSDRETIGTGGHDFGFMNALRKSAASSARLVQPSNGEALAACGWHRDAIGAGKDYSVSINSSLVLEFIMMRGEEVHHIPRVFSSVNSVAKSLAADLLAKRESYLDELVKSSGAVVVCASCNFAVALLSDLKEEGKVYTRPMQETDAWTNMRTFSRVPMKFDVSVFRKAGGALAEGHEVDVPSGHEWASGLMERRANCRNCGSQLGWRFERKDCKKQTYEAKEGGKWELVDRDRQEYSKVGRRNKFYEVPAEGPLLWGFIWRHMRVRRVGGEVVPSENWQSNPRRHLETAHNDARCDVCPQGHLLRKFPTGQGNGACRPWCYTCDLCDRDAKANWHMWGCGTCDYDVCDQCYDRRSRSTAISGRHMLMAN